jgi:hypothetical protein
MIMTQTMTEKKSGMYQAIAAGATGTEIINERKPRRFAGF